MKLFPRRITLVFALVAAPLFAQTSSTPSTTTTGSGFNEMTLAEQQQKAAEMLKQAQASPNGIASVTLNKYPNHFTMFTVRTKSGGAEQHDHYSDIFVVLDGEATEMIGGTIADSKTSSPGETRGSRVVGGVEHPMHKGDIIHISPGTPHQTMVAPGKTFTYYVIKVAE